MLEQKSWKQCRNYPMYFVHINVGLMLVPLLAVTNLLQKVLVLISPLFFSVLLLLLFSFLFCNLVQKKLKSEKIKLSKNKTWKYQLMKKWKKTKKPQNIKKFLRVWKDFLVTWRSYKTRLIDPTPYPSRVEIHHIT